MEDTTRPPIDVVRAHRFEVVDAEGVTRAVLGSLDHPSGDGGWGLGLYERDGERGWLATGPLGPGLAFVSAGNEVVAVGIVEGPDAAIPGPRLVLCDADGFPILSLHVPAGELPFDRD
ncbi:MAG: hypothetical protein HYU28_05470 [Actinobacteria bacterium]|nr:hypothetical protein [Actinomycetota bacterium]